MGSEMFEDLHLDELVDVEDGLGAAQFALQAVLDVGYVGLELVQAVKVLDHAHGHIGCQS